MARESFSRYQSYTAQIENRRRVVRIVKTLVILLVIYGFFQTVLLRGLRIQNESMAPQLTQGDLVLTSPLLAGPRVPVFGWSLPAVRSLSRGDLVEIKPGYHKPLPFWITGPDEILRFFTLNFFSLEDALTKEWDHSLTVKRLVGLPGDRIKIKDYTAYIQPPGASSFSSEYELSSSRYDLTKESLPEGWLEAYPLSAGSPEILLGPDEYYVLGDNRTGSSDSRLWGVVKGYDILSLVILKYWPFSEFGNP